MSKASQTKKPAATKAKKSKSSSLASPVQASTARTLQKPKKSWHKPKTWRTAQGASKPPLPKARPLMKTALQKLRACWKPAAGVTAVYGLGLILLVRGFSATQDFTTLKSLLNSLLTGSLSKVQSIFLQLSVLFGGANTSNTPNGGIYQSILLIVCSLAMIWLLRQSQAKKPIGTKLAFYRGMYPLIPFLAVMLIIGIQLLPLSIGAYLYSALVSGIAVHGWEILLSFLLFASLAYWSLRMLTSSVFALYIVTLPEMTPLKAIRSAKELVRGRRLVVWRKLLFLPLAIVVGSSVLILPFMLFLTPVVVAVFFVLSTAWFAIVHSYLYTLYRELLNE